MASPPHRLGLLRPGDSAVIRRVGCERGLARRLMELGLLPGTPVSVTRVAPLGDPLELRVRDFSLSIRRAEAAAVEVTDVRHPVPLRRRLPSVRPALQLQQADGGEDAREAAIADSGHAGGRLDARPRRGALRETGT